MHWYLLRHLLRPIQKLRCLLRLTRSLMRMLRHLLRPIQKLR
ncbi:hypothetical protein ERS044164_01928, partial [Streptococcus pneumoniae]